MPRKQDVTPYYSGLTIVSTGVFDLTELVTRLKEYLVRKKYIYHEKEFQELVSDKVELKLIWDAEREINDFYKYSINVYMFFEGLEQVTSPDHKKLDYANRITIKIKGQLIIDWKNNWGASKLKSKLLDFYLSSVIRDQSETEWFKLKQETEKVHSLAKSVLGLKD